MNKIDILLKNELYISCMDRIRQAEKERIFCLHGMEHSLDVARICYIMSLEQGLGVDKEIIYAMALLHDIGRCVEYEESNISHHDAGVAIARQILDECGFLCKDVDIICDAIASHKNKCTDDNILKELLFTADKLSRNCFSCEASDRCYWPLEQKNKSVTI